MQQDYNYSAHKLLRATLSPATKQQVEKPHSNQPSTFGVTPTIDSPTSSPVHNVSDSDSDFDAEKALRSDPDALLKEYF